MIKPNFPAELVNRHEISSETILNWHDGLLLSCEINKIGEKSSTDVTLYLALYDTHNAIQRKKTTLVLEHVQTITARLDLDELRNNGSAGTISNAYFKRSNIKSGAISLWLYLADGLIEIHFKSGSIVER
jgi:hypothetical protein